MNNQEPNQAPNPERMDGSERLPAPVYYVQSDRDPTVLVAMDVWLLGNSISWFDTVKERLMHGQVLEKTPQRFAFRRTADGGGQTYSFVPLTLEIYNSSVKDRLPAGRDFDDEQAMVDAFLRSFKNAW